MAKSLAVAFTGESNSGKTTLIVKIAEILTQKHSVAIIKHDPKDKAVFDKEGKDSYKFTKTGSKVAVISPKRTTYFLNEESDFDTVVKGLKPFDFLLVEGLKTLPLPRVAVFRESINKEYFAYIKAALCSKDVDKNLIPEEIEVLDLDDIPSIIEWIFTNAKEV